MKELVEVESLARDILEEWLDGRILQEFLVNVIKMCKSNITNSK
jgi:hypothetical protein